MIVPSEQFLPPSNLRGKKKKKREREYFPESFHPSNLVCVKETFHQNRTIETVVSEYAIYLCVIAEGAPILDALQDISTLFLVTGL